MSLGLKAALLQKRIPLSAMADAAGISRTAASLLCNHGAWPAREPAQVRDSIELFLNRHGIKPDAALFDFKKVPPGSNPTAPVPSVSTTTTASPTNEDTDMLLRKHRITLATREHFGLSADPFQECYESADVFMSGDIRYVREAMLDKAMHGGFLGVVGESGSGKTTLREELIDRLQREAKNVSVIQPYVLAMEATDRVGKSLKALHIAEAVMATIAPLAKIKSSPEARFRQLHDSLRESSRAGMRHVLIIEEAHSLPIPTLKHLKRFLELKDGMRPLISIILIGQPELAAKLSEGSPEVREVVQRIELVNLNPLDNHLEGYVKHRIERAGSPLARVLESSAIDALRTRLAPTKKGGMSQLYPLMVHNVLGRAMNIAAELGAPRVTADIVREV